jgi:hypothetical protein
MLTSVDNIQEIQILFSPSKADPAGECVAIMYVIDRREGVLHSRHLLREEDPFTQNVIDRIKLGLTMGL